MAAQMLDGNKQAELIFNKIRNLCKAHPDQNTGKIVSQKFKPMQAILISTNDITSRIYATNRMRKCQSVGIDCVIASVDPENPEHAVKFLTDWADDPDIDGIVIQKPSPFEMFAHIIPPNKDVEALNIDAEFDPCVPRGIMHLLHSTNQDLDGKHAVIIGRSDNIGKPIAQMLIEANCTTTICHSLTKNLAAITAQADILISAAQKPYLITANMVKPGAIVIDTSINHVQNPDNPDKTQVVGDVDYPLTKEVASWITPVPNGVQTIADAILLENVYLSHRDKISFQ